MAFNVRSSDGRSCTLADFARNYDRAIVRDPLVRDARIIVRYFKDLGKTVSIVIDLTGRFLTLSRDPRSCCSFKLFYRESSSGPKELYVRPVLLGDSIPVFENRRGVRVCTRLLATSLGI